MLSTVTSFAEPDTARPGMPRGPGRPIAATVASLKTWQILAEEDGPPDPAVCKAAMAEFGDREAALRLGGELADPVGAGRNSGGDDLVLPGLSQCG